MSNKNFNSLLTLINKGCFKLSLIDFNEFERLSTNTTKHGSYRLIYTASYTPTRGPHEEDTYKVEDIEELEIYINSSYQNLTDTQAQKIKKAIIKNS